MRTTTPSCIGSLLASIGVLSGLEELDVGGTAISDKGVLELGKLTALTRLILGGKASRISDTGVEAIKTLHRLQELSLRYTQVTSAIGPILGSLIGLEELDLSNTRIDSNVLEDIAHLPELRSLRLAHTDVDDRGLKALATLPQLARVDLRGTRTTRAGWAPLFDLPKLAAIEVDAEIPKAAEEPKDFHIAFDPPEPGPAGWDARWRLHHQGMKSGHQLVEIRDNATGKQVGAKLIYPAGYRSLQIICHAFSPDGKYVVLGGGTEQGKTWNTGQFIVWEIGSGEPVFLCHRRPNGKDFGMVRSVAFTADSRHIYFVADKYVRDGP